MGWREERDECGLGTDHAALTSLTELGPHVFEIVIALDALLIDSWITAADSYYKWWWYTEKKGLAL